MPGKWQCVRPVGCPVVDGHHVYILSLLSLCLGSWRSQCWFWDFHNFILFSCIYLAFHIPMWVYGYDFREFQSFRVLIRPNQEKHKENHNIKAAELTPPPTPITLMLLNSAIWFNIFKHKHKISRCLTRKVVSVKNLNFLWMKMRNRNGSWSVDPWTGPWWESVYVAGWLGVTDVSYSEVKCSSREREFHVFGHFGHEFEITKTAPYQFPCIFDLDLMLRTCTWDWI